MSSVPNVPSNSIDIFGLMVAVPVRHLSITRFRPSPSGFLKRGAEERTTKRPFRHARHWKRRRGGGAPAGNVRMRSSARFLHHDQPGVQCVNAPCIGSRIGGDTAPNALRAFTSLGSRCGAVTFADGFAAASHPLNGVRPPPAVGQSRCARRATGHSTAGAVAGETEPVILRRYASSTLLARSAPASTTASLRSAASISARCWRSSGTTSVTSSSTPLARPARPPPCLPCVTC